MLQEPATIDLLQVDGTVLDVVETGDNRAQLIQAVSGLQPGVAGGDLRAALQVAGSLARERSGFRNEVTIVSDGAFGDLPPIESGIAEMRVQTIGTSSDNQAVVSVRVRRSVDGSVRNYARCARVSRTPPPRGQVCAEGRAVPSDQLFLTRLE